MKDYLPAKMRYNEKEVEGIYGIDIFHNNGKSMFSLEPIKAPTNTIAITKAMSKIHKLRLHAIVNIVVTYLGHEFEYKRRVKK